MPLNRDRSRLPDQHRRAHILRTQFVYLTATLPPSMQAYFEERNYLHHPRIIRAPSNRPNIFYMVREIDPRKGAFLAKLRCRPKRHGWSRGFSTMPATRSFYTFGYTRMRTIWRATRLQLLHCGEWNADGEEADTRSLDPGSRCPLHRGDHGSRRKLRLSSRPTCHECRRARVTRESLLKSPVGQGEMASGRI